MLSEPNTTNGSQSQRNSFDQQKKRLGADGERLARAFFESRGFEILGQNWRCRYGEIDLIIGKEGRIRFVEVKTRRTMTYGYPEESITARKWAHLERAIQAWVDQTDRAVVDWQVDVLAIFLPSGQAPIITWLEAVHL